MCPTIFKCEDKIDIPNYEIKNVPESNIIKRETIKRRQLFDTIYLPEEFRAADYVKAIEEKGIKFTNEAMPYDDLRWLEKQGKVIKLDKEKNGPRFYRLVKKNDSESSTEEFANIGTK